MRIPHPADVAIGVSETLQNAAAATGNGAAIEVLGFQRLTVHLSGTFTATVTWEGSVDEGATYEAVGLTNATGTRATTATTAGTYSLDSLAPLTHFRARVSAFTSGTVTAKSRKAG